MNFETTVQNRLEYLYGSEKSAELLASVKELLEKYNFEIPETPPEPKSWSQTDVILITYGDTIVPQNGSRNKLETLTDFIVERLGDAISAVHILPFFASSSDMGFSVIDYKDVRDDLGDWDDIESLSKKYRVMADLVINHTSRHNKWFQNYRHGEQPGKDYFIEMDPTTDLSLAVRPRSTPLLTSVKTDRGLRYVWTTFSDDQIDLDFTNPDVLLEFIDIFLFYLHKGIKLVRLDAIAYLWKKIGTKSIHLNETHQVVKLFRDLTDYIDPTVTLITETNVPFEENISYFGDGDETHMVYQFSLPPLLLHAILTENAHYLSKWAENLPEPPEGCTYFNFTASHDGIGVRPLEGLVPNKEFKYLIEGTEERGGFVSYKTNSDGSQSPYELNITYYDAFSEPGKENSTLQMKRFLCSQIITLSLQGVPGIYIHNLIATPNYIEGVAKTGEKRAINRKQWHYEELDSYLSDHENPASQMLQNYKKLLHIRKQHPAFSPRAGQKIVNLGDKFFGILRKSVQNQEAILCISNITGKEQAIPAEEFKSYTNGHSELLNLIDGKVASVQQELTLNAFETVWLVL